MNPRDLMVVCAVAACLATGPVFAASANSTAALRGSVGPASAAADYAELNRLVAARPGPETPPTQPEIRLWWDRQSARIATLAETFIAASPSDPRRWKVAGYFLRSALHAVDESVRTARMRRALELAEEALEAPDIGNDDWQYVIEWKFYRLLQNPAQRAQGVLGLQPLRALLDDLTRRAPQAARLRSLEGQYIELLLRWDEVAAEARLAELARSENRGVAQQATGMLNLRSLRKKPVELKFTAIDGREIDLTAMRGRVVLIDFWATWCGPCIAEMPNVKRVYEAYHAKGFEVIGIALDKASDLGKLKAEIERLDLPWPQFIELEKPRNQFADDLGIIAIPAPLLFNQNGLLVSDRARGKRLEAEVKTLLGL